MQSVITTSYNYLKNITDKIKYLDLRDITAVLVRCVINDQEQCQNTLIILTSWVKKLCLKVHCYSTIVDVGNIDDTCNNHNNQNEDTFKIPISGQCLSLNNFKKKIYIWFRKAEDGTKKNQWYSTAR